MRVLAGERVAHYEAILRRSDGQDVHVSVAATPVPRPGRPPLAVSVLRNVSAARRLDEVREEFLSTAAHEFKTPLAVIKAYAQLMSRRDAGERRALAVIQRQVDRLTRLLEDILEGTRLRTGEGSGRPERFDLAALARAAADRLRPAAPGHALAVDADGPISVVADRDRIARVLANLLENAVRFSPRGGEVRIHVESTRRPGGRLGARTAASGSRRSARARCSGATTAPTPGPSTTTAGSGVGLEVSRARRRAPRRPDVVRERPGRGVHLPLRPPALPRGRVSCRAPILVVEDDPDLLSLVEMILADAGYRVATAREGRAALARCAEELPALVLLDMRMPGMNGWDFAREFRARHGRSVPIVVVTAAENARARAEEIGAEGWLAKPFDIEDVLRTARSHAGPPVDGPAAPR